MPKKRIAVKEDWDELYPMPEEHKELAYDHVFSESEIRNLRAGHIPAEMEDRWFSYMEENTLHIYRSWTGICIYEVSFDFETGCHRVIVNRNTNQYNNMDDDYDLGALDNILAMMSFEPLRE